MNEFKVKKGLIIQGSGSALLDIQGSQGQLFSITDSLEGSLFSVNDISGIPVMEVFSDDTINLGTFGDEAIKISGNTANITGSLFGTSSFATTAGSTSAVSGTTNYLPKFTGTSTLGNSLLFDNGTNVGIGTTSPQSPLQVGNYTFSGGYTRGRVATFAGGWISTLPTLALISTDSTLTQNKGGGIAFGGGSENSSTPYTYAQIKGLKEVAGAGYSGYMSFYTTPAGSDANTERMRITSTGNVGIGTTSPSEKLNVSGNILATGFIKGASIGMTNIVTGYVPYHNGSILDDSPIYTNGTGNVGIGTNTPKNDLSVGTTSTSLQTKSIHLGYTTIDHYGFRLSNTNTASSTAAGTFSIQRGTTSAWVDDLTINNSGNVGIGTTSPTSKLQVNTSTENDGIKLIGSSPNTRLTVENSGAITGERVMSITSNSSVTGLIFQNLNDNYTFSSNLMIIKPNGNVGIGTTSPDAKLQITSVPSNIPSILANDIYARASFGPQGSSGDAHFGASGNGAPTIGLQDYGFYAAHNAYRSSTGAWKHTRLNTIPSVRLLGSGGVSGGNQGFSFDYSSNVGAADITWTNLMQILPSGNVGIGTTSPGYNLQVGDGSQDTESRFYHNDGAYTSVRGDGLFMSRINSYIRPVTDEGQTLYIGVTGQSWNTIHHNAVLHTFSKDGNEFMRITSTGNVGIGTTTPSYKLSVVGKISLNDGGGSVFVGEGAGLNDDDTTDNRNVGIGYQSLLSNTTGYNNTANGFQSLYSNTTGTNNTANGYQSLYYNTTGAQNTTTGYLSLHLNTTGNNNTANGYLSLYSNTTGFQNIAIGKEAGRFAGTTTANETGTNSVFLGYLTKANANGQTNQIVIGASATGIGSNTVTLGNDSIVTTALKGNVGIGTTAPSYKLDVNGGIGVSRTSGIVFTGASFAGSSIKTDASNTLIFSTTLPSVPYTETKAMYINDGNVGIGVSSPTKKLHISSNDQSTSRIRIQNTATGGDTFDLVAGAHNALQDGFSIFNSGSATTNLYIEGTGDVGIGNISPAYRLDVTGTIRATGDIIANSDIRVKENINTIENALEKVKQLRGIEYNKIGGTKQNIGVVAQEVEKILPEVVHEDEKGMKSVAYGNIVGVLIEAIKEQQKQIDELKKLIK